MLNLYHSPRSRSSRIIRLIDELDIWNEIDIRIVNITHSDGMGEHDPNNPHPEGKVPLLVHEGCVFQEPTAPIASLMQHQSQKLAAVNDLAKAGRAKTSNIAARSAFAVEFRTTADF